MKKTTKLILVGTILLLLAGCGTTTKQVVRRSEILSPTGQPIVAVRPQYVVPREEEDPLVAQARAIGRQQAQARERWKAACLALRQGDPYATYNTCRQVLGDDRNLSSGSGYYGGRGSILSSPGIVWIK